MHHAQHHQHQADLRAQVLDCLLGVAGRRAELECQGDVTDVYQVKANHHRVVHGIGKRLVACHAVYQENAAVLVQGSRHPYGYRHADEQVSGIGPHHDHNWLLSHLTLLISCLAILIYNQGSHRNGDCYTFFPRTLSCARPRARSATSSARPAPATTTRCNNSSSAIGSLFAWSFAAGPGGGCRHASTIPTSCKRRSSGSWRISPSFTARKKPSGA